MPFADMVKHCLHCGELLKLNNNRDIERKKFCSHSCRAKAYLTEDRVKKFLASGQTPEAHSKKGFKKEDHPRWIKDRLKVKVKRSISEMRWWRQEVFKRDSYTCQSCFKIGVDLQAHHKAPVVAFPQFRFDVSNGVTLCKKCHFEIHFTADEMWNVGKFMNKVKGPRYASYE
jgi:5-methylcytosine-specific restriction endonuclease McrA